MEYYEQLRAELAKLETMNMTIAEIFDALAENAAVADAQELQTIAQTSKLASDYHRRYGVLVSSVRRLERAVQRRLE